MKLNQLEAIRVTSKKDSLEGSEVKVIGLAKLFSPRNWKLIRVNAARQSTLTSMTQHTQPIQREKLHSDDLTELKVAS